MATAHASVADIRSWQLGQPREQLHRPSWVAQMSFSSRKCCFPRPSLVAAIIFPHTKWLPKITDYHDTAALNLELKKKKKRFFDQRFKSTFCLIALPSCSHLRKSFDFWWALYSACNASISAVIFSPPHFTGLVLWRCAPTWSPPIDRASPSCAGIW